MSSPLNRVTSIKMKLGALVVAAVAITVLLTFIGVHIGVWPSVSGVVSGLIAIGMVRVLARGLTTPLREMADAADAMAHGTYDRRVSETSRDEIGALAVAFNKMAAELAETDRVRRDLVANVSHELRTPITALQAVLENLVDGVEPPDPQTLRTMLAQVERLGRLVTQLLDLSRLESGTVPLDRQPFTVRPLLEHAVRESQLHAPGVDIAVGARRDGDVVRIEVSDEGPGIPESEASRVFERFYRADQARSSTDGGGAGLGLAIARWIVELHGGEIRPERREPHGCRMVVTLPAATRPYAGAPAGAPAPVPS